ncbi:aspartate aminotransferase family protein [Luteitalea sp. TBR-22]|uniref:pyridoxal phosphate-dependent decarboxylase family protein n=1 Tax=Luteitalea sp. TBR-22 TaxID=2802971 RepID=UPI001AF0EA77|nr:pyridoxal-dependent decarboxylase [Luteitalea sp. TBR-22]BCS34038.1 aspartate aminotransferase family protein [Luteitalea sp. TBR-22]
MSTSYKDLVSQLRSAFPAPVSDRLHDAYFVFSCLRALDQVDALKSAAPMLGTPVTLDYDAARRRRVGEHPMTLEAVTSELVQYLSGMFIWGHPRAQINVVPPPTIPSIIGGLLPSIYNPNLVSDESSRQVSIAEVEAIAMTAGLVGYDPAVADGVFTFGGTGTLMYAGKIGLEKAMPGVRESGLREPAVLVCSDRAHYANLTVANWLGLGEAQVVKVPSTDDNEIRIDAYTRELTSLVDAGARIACIVATMGTTDAFGLDDLAAMVRVRDELVQSRGLDYVPHVHADAVIGWAWSVFNDYDFDGNPLGFRHRTVRALAGTARRIRHLGLADSLGVDYHKTGFTPYISSAVLVKDGRDLTRLARREEDTPYIFQSGERHPGRYTIETSRAGSGPLAALANLRLFGRQGLQALLGHLVAMAEELREQLEGHPSTTVLNGDNFGPVTLFRVYPDDVDTFAMPEQERRDPAYRERLLAHNAYNRRVFELIQADALQGVGVVISLTDCYRESEYGEPIVALKSYILSPFSDEAQVHAVLDSIAKARRAIAAGA